MIRHVILSDSFFDVGVKKFATALSAFGVSEHQSYGSSDSYWLLLTVAASLLEAETLLYLGCLIASSEQVDLPCSLDACAKALVRLCWVADCCRGLFVGIVGCVCLRNTSTRQHGATCAFDVSQLHAIQASTLGF
jgi:hypothetical protein